MNNFNPFENSLDLTFTKSPLRELLRNSVGFSVSSLKGFVFILDDILKVYNISYNLEKI
jgi:hypothetical protein